MPSNKCMYCSPDSPAEARITEEHVLSKAFGEFQDKHTRSKFTLKDGVCHCCNQFFGNNLEVIFARTGSLESVLRLAYKIVSPDKKAKYLRKDWVRSSLKATGKLDGLVLEFQSENDELIVSIVPQVGFPRRDRAGWIYITESELANLSKPLPEEIDITKLNILIFNSEEVKLRLNQLLARRNIKVQEQISEDLLPLQKGQEIDVAVESKINSIVFRCIAKYAFNYLAKIAGIDFVVKTDFNPIRAYIRYGVEPNYQIVTISNRPILANDTLLRQKTSGHLIVIDFPPNGRDIVGQVSLFNSITYNVVLAKNFSGLWRPIRSGHHFNIQQMVAEPVDWIF